MSTLPGHKAALHAAAAALLAGPLCLVAYAGGPPDWVTAAAHAPLPDYPKTTKAVVLDQEEVLSVGADGKATLHKRRVIKILRPQGRGFATVYVPFDHDRKIHSIHVWCIAADGHPYTLSDKEIVDVGNAEYGMLYVDLRARVAKAPAADPGSLVAYEYEQTTRPYIHEYSWDFQDSIPVVHTAFELDLPKDWHQVAASRGAVGLNATEPEPNHFRWQVDHVPAIDTDDVPMVPEFASLAGRLSVRYSHEPLPATQDTSWTAIGEWYTDLASPSGAVTPEVRAKAEQLTAGKSDFTAKVQAIADYMQRNIRYVGIEIGIGGYQPHNAADIFRNQYGDCKDKVTLMRALLESVGIHATWVLVDTERGYVDPRVPSAFGNHAIAAIELPPGYSNPALQSVVTTRSGKHYLIFDPTNEWVPLGQLPPYEQGGYGILSDGAGSQLVELPSITPDANYTDQIIHATLQPTGALDVDVAEKRFGEDAVRTRRVFAQASQKDQHDLIERRLRTANPSIALRQIAAAHAIDLNQPLELNYSFQVTGYAREAGDLLLVRPNVFGSDAWSLPREPRQWPIDLGSIQRRTQHVDITLPPGYVADELPDPVNLDTDFASYHSAVTADATSLHYTRTYTVKQLQLDAARYDDVRKFSERVAYDEASSAVLKKK